MVKKDYKHPGLINSSYVVFFHLSVFLIAPFMVSAFPDTLQKQAWAVSIWMAIAIFWFSYFLKQFDSITTILNFILSFAYISAILAVLNAAYGSLSDEYAPIIYTQLPFFATLAAGYSGPVGVIYAGYIMTYGIYTYLGSISVALFAESVYESIDRKVLPKFLHKKLQKVDKEVDADAANYSDKYFLFNQSVGLGISISFLITYGLIYLYLILL